MSSLNHTPEPCLQFVYVLLNTVYRRLGALSSKSTPCPGKVSSWPLPSTTSVAPWLVATLNVPTRKLKEEQCHPWGQGACLWAELLPSMYNKRLGESLRMLSPLGKFPAQETKHGQNRDHERGIENMHSEESPLGKVPV